MRELVGTISGLVLFPGLNSTFLMGEVAVGEERDIDACFLLGLAPS